MFLQLVRGNTDYGMNDFSDNGDGSISYLATGLMWSKDDSLEAMTWKEALTWVGSQNETEYLGYNDWRLPNIKELQSIVDYTRSPASSNSASIDPVFNTSSVINEAGNPDYPFYWSSTTHMNFSENHQGSTAAQVAFGRSMGYMNNSWIDIHGAGSQRSDPR